MEFGLDKRAQTLQGLAFPLQEEAKRALQQLKQRRINYIQLVSPNKTHFYELLSVHHVTYLYKTNKLSEYVLQQTVYQCMSVKCSEIGCA